jgi:hypothetical protein
MRVAAGFRRPAKPRRGKKALWRCGKPAISKWALWPSPALPSWPTPAPHIPHCSCQIASAAAAARRPAAQPERLTDGRLSAALPSSLCQYDPSVCPPLPPPLHPRPRHCAISIWTLAPAARTRPGRPTSCAPPFRRPPSSRCCPVDALELAPLLSPAR